MKAEAFQLATLPGLGADCAVARAPAAGVSGIDRAAVDSAAAG